MNIYLSEGLSMDRDHVSKYLKKSNSSTQVPGPTSEVSLHNVLLIFSRALEQADPPVRIVRVHSLAIDTVHE